MTGSSSKTWEAAGYTQRPYVALLALISTAYAYRIGFDLIGWWPGAVPLLWGAPAFLLAPLLLLGWRYLPVLAVFAALAQFYQQGNWEDALLATAGDVAGAAAVALALERWIPVDLRFRQQGDLWRLVLVAMLNCRPKLLNR